MKLGARLTKIASYVKKNLILADIGTDHAYLPIYLVKEGIVPKAIALDVAAGPLEAAKNSVKAADLCAKIELRLGDGLAPLSPGEAQVITIAGMGGGTIKSILEAQLAIAQSADTLILQPMGEAADLRRFLYLQGWQISEEDLVLEGEHLYQILVATYCPSEKPREFDNFSLEVGLGLLAKQPVHFREHVENVLRKYTHICCNMEKSPVASQSKKYRQAKVILEQAKEFLQCLSDSKNY